MGLDEQLDATGIFTPLKAIPSFEIAQDGEEDILTRIPHGLTAKKEHRRKSYHHHDTKVSGDLFGLSPMRVPLTAPRPNVLNSRPLADSTSLIHTKRSLMSQLESIKGDKENDTPLASKTLTPIKFTALDMSALSSPHVSGQKRRSSFGEDESGSPFSKIARVPKDQNTFEVFADASQTETVDLHEAGPSDDEELSRIEPFGAETEIAVSRSSIVATQEDEIQVDQSLADTTATPSRQTEPVALSPDTEQRSRIVDDACLQLDTSKSPVVDATDSPLSQQKNDIFVDLGPIEDYEACVSPQKHVQIVSPRKKPFFTISQVHEIQSDFKKEVEKLEHHLKTKSVAIMELNDQINNGNNKIYQLQDELDSIALQKKQLVQENDLLKAENDVFKGDVASLEQSVKKNEEKVERNKYVITKFKEKVQELNALITEKNKEIDELKQDTESKSRAIAVLTSRAEDYEAQTKTLSGSVHQETERANAAEAKCVDLESSIFDLKTQLDTLASEKASLKATIETLSNELQANQLETDELKSKFESDENQMKEAETKYTTLTAEITGLEEKVQTLQTQLEAQRFESEAAICEIAASLQKATRELNLKNAMLNGLQAAVETLKESNVVLRSEINTQAVLNQSTTAELAESNELLTIRKAEVDELNIEMKSAQTELTALRTTIEQKNIQLNELNDTLQSYIHALEDKDLSIRKMETELQKQEGDHLAELEAFHAEMSNVQAIVGTKSNELFKLKEDKDNLQREHDLLKYELDNLKDEAGDYDTRISTLKAKLQESRAATEQSEKLAKRMEEEKLELEREIDKRLQQLAEDLYIQYSKKHEQKVQVLKKGYETKWHGKVARAEAENDKLRREIEGLKARIEKETAEKNEIIKLWDNFKEADQSA